MDLARESNSISAYDTENGVSILVLVDLARESASAAGLLSNAGSFNPCFSGSCSRMHLIQQLESSQYMVSILVLVDLARE